MSESNATENLTPTQRITQQIAELADWRGQMLADLRDLILAADPQIVEEWKWSRGSWACRGNVVAVGVFKQHLKMSFYEGASLPDPHSLFNASLDSKTMRAIDFHEGDTIEEEPLAELIRTAVAHNKAGKKK